MSRSGLDCSWNSSIVAVIEAAHEGVQISSDTNVVVCRLEMLGAAGRADDTVIGGARAVRDGRRDRVRGPRRGKREERGPGEVTVRPCWTWTHLGLSGR